MRTILYKAGRWTSVVLMVLMLFLMAGTTPKTADVSIDQLESAVLPAFNADAQPASGTVDQPGDDGAQGGGAASFSGTQKGDGRMIRRFYGLEPTEYEGVMLYYPDTNMGVNELLVVKLSDISQSEAVQQAAEARIESQKNVFEGYGVDQMDMLTNDTVIEARGPYVLFVCSKNAQKVRQAFLDML